MHLLIFVDRNNTKAVYMSFSKMLLSYAILLEVGFSFSVK